MGRRLFGAQPLPNQMMGYCLVEPWEKKLQWNLNQNATIPFTKMHLKMPSALINIWYRQRFNHKRCKRCYFSHGQRTVPFCQFVTNKNRLRSSVRQCFLDNMAEVCICIERGRTPTVITLFMNYCSVTRQCHLLSSPFAQTVDAISQKTFSNAFSSTKVYELRLRFHWNLFLSFESTIYHLWFK